MLAMPRSLRGRTLLLTVIGIIACELVTFAVLGVYRHRLLAGRARDFASGQVELVRTALTHAPAAEVARELDTPPHERRGGLVPPPGRHGSPRTDPERHDEAAPPDDRGDRGDPRDRRPPPVGDPGGGPRPDASMSDKLLSGDFRGPGPRGFSHMRLVETLPSNASAREPDDLALPQVVAALREEHGDDALRFTDEPEPAVWVRMPSATPSAGWWLMLPFSRYSSPPVPWAVLLTTLAAVGVMGGLVGLYSVHLSRPLRALSEAAANYKVGLRPELPLTGPDEIRAVTAQFNAMAERLERDDAQRRVMLAGLPHDLRAPLSRAKLRLELMDDAPDGPKAGLQRDLAEVGKIADQFVAYLRGLDHDRSAFKRLALADLVRDRGLVWRESGHDVTIERVDACVLEADADGLMRAIDNLIGNAFAHGAPPVKLAGLMALDGARRSYRIVVRDHGRGIPPEKRTEALEPFTRLDAARGASGHCGLGLAVAQSVARHHDGRIELADAEGGGLAAAIVLPVPPDAA